MKKKVIFEFRVWEDILNVANHSSDEELLLYAVKYPY